MASDRAACICCRALLRDDGGPEAPDALGKTARVVLGLVDHESYVYAEAATDAWRIGQVVDGVDTVLASSGSGTPIPGQATSMRVEVEEGEVRVHAGGSQRVAHDFGGAFAGGGTGVGSLGTGVTFEDVEIAVELVELGRRSTYYHAL
jgi:hypothetical protein